MRRHPRRGWPRVPGAHLAGIADVNFHDARRLADDLGNPPIYGSLDEMLGARDIDAVLIAVASSAHLEAIRTAASAGRLFGSAIRECLEA